MDHYYNKMHILISFLFTKISRTILLFKCPPLIRIFLAPIFTKMRAARILSDAFCIFTPDKMKSFCEKHPNSLIAFYGKELTP